MSLITAFGNSNSDSDSESEDNAIIIRELAYHTACSGDAFITLDFM